MKLRELGNLAKIRLRLAPCSKWRNKCFILLWKWRLVKQSHFEYYFCNLAGPKRCGGEGQNDPLGMDKACMSSIFVKTSQIFFWWKLLDVSFHQIFFEKLRMIEVGPRLKIEGTERGHPFFRHRILAKKVCS